MTVNDFIDDLTALGQELSEPQSILTELGTDIVESMKRNVPVDKGRLRDSISYVVNGNKIEFAMLEYGFYQNYGVFPNYNTRSYHKPFNNEFGGIKQPIANEFGIPAIGFRNRRFGLPRRQFFDYGNIEQIIQGGITEAFDNF